MSSIFTMALSLITFFLLASCASTARTVAAENKVQRSPEGDSRAFTNKIANRKYITEKY